MRLAYYFLCMKKRLKTAGIISGVLLACLLIVVVGFVFFLNTDHFRNLLLSRINRSIPGKVMLNDHRIFFLPGIVVFEELVLKDRAGNDLAMLEHLKVDISFLSLLNKTVAFKTIHIKNPDVRVIIAKDGEIDLVKAIQEDSPEKRTGIEERAVLPFNVLVEDFSIENGTFKLSTESENRRIDLEQIDVKANADLLKQTGKITFHIEKNVLSQGADLIEIQPVTGSVILSQNRIGTIYLEAKSEVADITLSGDVHNAFADPRLNLSVTYDLSLSELGTLNLLPSQFTGKTNGVLDVRGDWKNPDVDLALTYDGGALSGYPIDGARVNVNLTDRRIAVTAMDIKAGSAEINVSGEIDLRPVFPDGFISTPTLEGLTYQTRAILKHVDLSLFIGDIADLKGILDATLTVNGHGINMQTLFADTTVDADLRQFKMSGMKHPTDLSVKGSVSINKNRVNLRNLELRSEATYLNTLGNMDLSTKKVKGHLTARTENMAVPLSLFGVTRPSGTLALDAELSGFLYQPDIDVSIIGKRFAIDDIRLGDVTLKAALDGNGLLTIPSLTLHNQASRVTADGSIQLFGENFSFHETMPLEARLNIIEANVSNFLEKSIINGSLSGELQIAGDIASLGAQAVLKGKEVVYDKLSIDSVDAVVQFKNGAFYLERLGLKKKRSECVLSGKAHLLAGDSWKILEDPVVDVNMRANAVYIEDFFEGMHGALTIDGFLQGPLSRLQGKGRLLGETLDLAGQHVEKVELNAEISDNRIYISPLQAVVSNRNIVTGSGWFGFDRTFSIDLEAEDFGMRSITKVRKMENVDGTLDFHVSGKGSVADPVISGVVDVRNVRVNDEAMEEFNFQIDLINSKLTVKGHQTFDLDLDYHLLQKDFQIDLLFEDTDVTPFLLVTGRKKFAGKMSGRIKARGTTDVLRKSEAKINITALDLTYLGKPFIHTENLHWELKNQILSMPESYLNLMTSGRLKVAGFGDLNGSMDVVLEGEIPAKTAAFFAEDLANLEGTIMLSVMMKGAYDKPALTGEIRFRDLGMPLPQIGQSVQDVNGTVRITPSRINIDGISGRIGEGTFKIKGDVGLDRFEPKDIYFELKSNRLPIEIPATMDLTINTNLTAAGSMDGLNIKGDIVLLSGVYYKDVKMNLFQRISERRREEIPSIKEAHPFLSNMTVDIRVKRREPLVVDNNIAQLEISPDFAISGNLNDPVISGSATVDSGTINYQNKHFVLQKGNIDFVNPYEIKPDIDIEADVEIRKWKITLSLYGPPDRLLFELTSNPPEENADIVSLLVFGKTTYELGQDDQSAFSSPKVMMAQLMASSFGEDIKGATGFDYLAVETENNAEEALSETVRVTVGKDLTERMMVKYSIESNESDSVRRTSTEYKLLEHLLLSGFQDSKGSYGGEIVFRVEFRLLP